MDFKKRKWRAIYTEDDGKFFTGFVDYGDRVVEGEHKVITTVLKPDGFSRGRSSAVFRFKDQDGFVYEMSCKGTAKLLNMLAEERVVVDEVGFFVLDIVQVKQGQNYAVEPV